MNRARTSITSVGLALLLAACGSNGGSGGGEGGSQNGGSGGSQNGGSGGSQNGGSGGSQNGGSGGSQNGGSGGSQNGGSGGGENGGAGGSQNGGSGGGQNGGAGGGAGGKATGGSTTPNGGSGPAGAGGGPGGTTSAGGSQAGGGPGGAGGSSPPATGGVVGPTTVLVTSASSGYWKTGTWTESTASATVTVNDSSAAQTWEGFGGAFNELGWKYLSSAAMQDEAMKLLFSATDGAAFTWGRIPMGASDYGESRFTYSDTGSDVVPDGSESNRPPADTSLAKFSLDRDVQKLIPYIKAAQKVNPALRFWASPWTPPVWMKTGYKKDAAGSGTAKKASYYDGGNFKNDASFITAYAEYYKKFVLGYKEQGINVEVVSPQNEPGYDQNYPSCLWDKATYVAFVKALGPVMKEINVKVMLGTMSNAGDNSRTDLDIASAVLADSTAKGLVSVVGVQWGVLDKVIGGQTFSGLPVWATEHKCGNYPWNPSGAPSYNNTQAPNDMAYAVESWGYLRDAIKKGKVTSYNAWNMVLDKLGLGNDTSRDWKQNALLVADGGKVNATPTYYVFRHLSQYVAPGATVVGTTGGDAVAFKNPDGSIVAVMYNSGSANSSYSVKIGSKTLQFSMPEKGWATAKYKP